MSIASRDILNEVAKPQNSLSKHSMAETLSQRIGDFFSLGFVSETPAPDLPLQLGKKRPSRRDEILLEVVAWIVLALGIFLRKGLVLRELILDTSQLTAGRFLASVVIALAVFPMFMRWFTKRRPTVGLLHFATAFAFGFFLDLAAVSAFRYAPHF